MGAFCQSVLQGQCSLIRVALVPGKADLRRLCGGGEYVQRIGQCGGNGTVHRVAGVQKLLICGLEDRLLIPADGLPSYDCA